MSAGDANNWRKRCYGRDELQSKMQEAYRLSVAGMPQFLVLKGMTGVGKTRLVQELYRWLSTETQIDPSTEAHPQGYWPDWLISEATKDRVNPQFDTRQRPPIPFLWLGLKFDEPASLPANVSADVAMHLQLADSGKALRDALPHLMPHAIQAIVKRDIRDVHGDWLWKAFGLTMDVAGFFVGPITTVPGKIKDLWETWKGQQKKQAAAEKASEPVLISQQQSEQESIDQFLNTLRLFLDARQADLSTKTSTQIPVVLFLDDAHWGDPLTLRMVKQLWAEAHGSKWPLLVVDTHWDDEWELHQQLPESPGTPLKMAHFQQRIDPGGNVGGIREIPVCGLPADDLRTWLAATLPGLTADQQALLLHKSEAAAVDKDGNSIEGGSPRVLEHLIQLLLDDPADAFVAGDPRGPIQDGFVVTIRDEIFDLDEIITRRFKKLPREIRRALGWGSEQGRRFLCEINTAIARHLEDGPEVDDALNSIRQAESPHHWIDGIPQTVDGESRYNLCEFRSNVFREVAKKHYSRNTDTIAAVRDALSSVLSGWLFAGRLNAPEDIDLLSPDDLTVPERRDALRICINHFRPSDPATTDDEQWKVYGNALARLTQLDLWGYKWGEPIFWDQALAAAVEFATARPDGWDVSLVEVHWQIEVVDLLWNMRRFELAQTLLKSLHRQLDIARTATDQASLRQYALICERLAVVQQLKNGTNDELLSLYLESLQVRREIVTEFGRSPESLRDVSVQLQTGDAVRCC